MNNVQHLTLTQLAIIEDLVLGGVDDLIEDMRESPYPYNGRQLQAFIRELGLEKDFSNVDWGEVQEESITKVGKLDDQEGPRKHRSEYASLNPHSQVDYFEDIMGYYDENHGDLADMLQFVATLNIVAREVQERAMKFMEVQGLI